MKICFVIPIDLLSQETLQLPYFRCIKEISVLTKANSKISVISWLRYYKDLPEFELKNDTEIYRIYLYPPKRNLLRRILFYFKLVRTIANKIKEVKPDIIICHDLELLYACVKAKKELNVPLIYECHDDCPAVISIRSKLEGKIAYLLERILTRSVDHTFTASDLVTDKFRMWGKKANTLYNVRPLSEVLEAPKIKRPVEFGSGDFIVGYSGRLSERRCIKELIKMLTLLPANIKLMIVGGSDKEVEYYKNYAKECGIKNRVYFTGMVPYDKAPSYIKIFNAGVMVSLPDPNFFTFMPNKLFEYMGAGIPAVVNDFPGMRKIIIEEKSGLTIKSHNAKDISDAILYLLEHPEEAKEMGERGRNAFLEKYHWEKEEEKFLAKIKEIAKK